ncbi:hypothetical protein GCM10007989_27820 [Devosia pacifica]|uniref:DUF721 domain-containing protein n=1 Tax=Devosia pacifica TaxID=1335967 RepID=A0A918S8S6_9HYPH|nr:DciA family protein [Devosia pacifica]GHA30466.1 hypothetical protein GCM10007989_27820 [Devosia pacifica]
MSKAPKQIKRRNKAVGVAEALGGVLDPALKKRGFASRDLLEHWVSIAPPPYDQVCRPDRLSWPRGERSAEGATLVLCCADGHGLAVAHDGARIAAAVNRYFGYVLVREVRLSAAPFMPHSSDGAKTAEGPSSEIRAAVGRMVDAIEDEGLREALRRLGHNVMTNEKSTRR